MVAALDDLVKERRAVLNRLGENLEQVAVLIIVDEDVQLGEHVHVLGDLKVGVLEADLEVLIVRRRHGQELAAARAQGLDRLDDVVGAERNVLRAGAAVKLDILLDLRLALADGGLVDGHLDLFVIVGHDDRAESRKLGHDLLVVDGPEAVEVEHLLVPLGDGDHLVVALVADNVINVHEAGGGEELLEGIDVGGRLKVGEEETLVLVALHKGVHGVAVRADRGKGDAAILIGLGPGLADNNSAARDGLVKDALDIVNGEGD